MVAVDQTVAHLDLVHVARQQTARSQIHQFTDDVGASQVDIVFTLAIGKLHLQITGFGVHQEGGKRVGITQEQDVRQRHIAPVEAGQVQANQQHGKGVDQTLGSIRLEIAGEQRAVRQ